MTVLGVFNFTGSSLAASSVDPNLTISDISETGPGTGGVQTALGYSTDPIYNLTAGASTSESLAVSNGNFYNFDITPNSGFQVSIDDITFKAAKGGTSIGRGTAVRSSVDSYATSVLSITPTNARTTWATFTATFGTDHDNLIATTNIRFYVWGPTTGATIDFDDVTINGTVTSTGTPIGKAIDLRWNVFAVVGKPIDLRWNLLAKLGKSLDLRWNVLEVVTVIGKTIDLRWNVLTKVERPLDLRWNILAKLGKTIDLRWNILTKVGKVIDLRWNILNSIAKSLDLRWNILTKIAKSIDLRWNVLEVVLTAAKTIDLQWNVRATVGKSLTLQWEVQQLFSLIWRKITNEITSIWAKDAGNVGVWDKIPNPPPTDWDK
jgi:hypothetical protein